VRHRRAGCAQRARARDIFPELPDYPARIDRLEPTLLAAATELLDTLERHGSRADRRRLAALAREGRMFDLVYDAAVATAGVYTTENDLLPPGTLH
jgi:hypothetical protein